MACYFGGSRFYLPHCAHNCADLESILHSEVLDVVELRAFLSPDNAVTSKKQTRVRHGVSLAQLRRPAIGQLSVSLTGTKSQRIAMQIPASGLIFSP